MEYPAFLKILGRIGELCLIILISDKNKIFNFLFACTAFLGLSPYFIWHTSGLLFQIFIISTFSFFIVITITEKPKYNRVNYMLVFFCIFVYIALYHSNLERLIKALILGLLLFAFLLVRNEDKLESFKYFTILFSISLIPGLILYISNLIGIDLAWSYLEPINPLKTQLGHYYRRYLGSVVLISSRSAPIWPYRFCGMFDEPGVVGTVSALLLVGNRFNFKSFYVKILLISGIITFSLAFFVIVIASLVIELILRRNFRIVIIIGCFFSLFILFSTYLEDNYLIQRYVLNRITNLGSGLIVDNRTTQSFDYEFEQFFHRGLNTILFGEGVGSRSDNMNLLGSSSIKLVIYDSGIIGFSALILLFIVLVLCHKSKQAVIFLVIFIASMYQRPSVLNYAYILIFMGSILNTSMANQSDTYKYSKNAITSNIVTKY